MMCFLSVAVITTIMATIGFGDRDTADRGRMSSIEPYRTDSESTKLSGCGNTANANTKSTESKETISGANTFMRSLCARTGTTMTIKATAADEAEATEKVNTKKT